MWCDVIAKENDTCKLKEMEKDKLRWKQWFGMGMNFSWTMYGIHTYIRFDRVAMHRKCCEICNKSNQFLINDNPSPEMRRSSEPRVETQKGCDFRKLKLRKAQGSQILEGTGRFYLQSFFSLIVLIERGEGAERERHSFQMCYCIKNNVLSAIITTTSS